MSGLEEQARFEHRVAPVAEHLQADGADDRRPGLERQHHLLDRQARQQPVAHGCHGRTQLRRHGLRLGARTESARLLRRHQRADEGRRHPRVRLDRVLRCLVARDGRAEDQPPLVGMREGPPAQGAGHRHPPRGVAGRRRRDVALGPVGRPLGLARQRLVGPEDEGAQQGIAPVEVAVQRGGGHPQVPGDGAQGQRGGAVAGDVLPRHGQDLRRHLLADPLPGAARCGCGCGCGGHWGGGGRRCGHGASLPVLD